MSPRALDLKVVADRLGYRQQLLSHLRQLPIVSFEDFTADWRNVPTAESLLRRAIEATLDIARHLLSSSHGVGALEYRRAARLAGEHGLIPDPEVATVFEEIAGFRNRLTHMYDEVTPEELFKILRDHLDDLDQIAEALGEAASKLAEEQSP